MKAQMLEEVQSLSANVKALEQEWDQLNLKIKTTESDDTSIAL